MINSQLCTSYVEMEAPNKIKRDSVIRKREPSVERDCRMLPFNVVVKIKRITREDASSDVSSSGAAYKWDKREE
jgi:hypothetical protein